MVVAALRSMPFVTNLEGSSFRWGPSKIALKLFGIGSFRKSPPEAVYWNVVN
jgi:hypothetical protein